MNNQITLQFSYINHQINEPLNDENIISELNPVVNGVRTTPQFFVNTSNVNPYQSGTYTATILCQVGDQRLEQNFKVNVKDFNRLNGNNVVNNQNNNIPQSNQNYAPRKPSTAKKIWIGILVFVLIVLGLTSCSIYNQAKTNQAQNSAQNQKLQTELNQVKQAQKTYQENHDKQQLESTLSGIQSEISQLQNDNATAALNNQISKIQSNPDSSKLESEMDGLKAQIQQQSGIIQEMQNVLNSVLSKIGL
ncbi:hypothetical protein [Fructilactobacillus frigidiflavus]|uniref:hypothetical protein n=1 Tax=Fructilactobacillus frigidiflavus TaxID=3242688 RepID=UPI003757253E